MMMQTVSICADASYASTRSSEHSRSTEPVNSQPSEPSAHVQRQRQRSFG